MERIITLLVSKERRWALLAERPGTGEKTPLHVAAEAGKLGAVQALLHAADEDEGEGPMSMTVP